MGLMSLASVGPVEKHQQNEAVTPARRRPTGLHVLMAMIDVPTSGVATVDLDRFIREYIERVVNQHDMSAVDEMVSERRASMDKDQCEEGKVQREMHRPEDMRQRVVLGYEVRKRDDAEVDDLYARRRAVDPPRQWNHQHQHVQ